MWIRLARLLGWIMIIVISLVEGEKAMRKTFADKLVDSYRKDMLEVARAGYTRQMKAAEVEFIKGRVLGAALADGSIAGKNELERKIQVDAILADDKVYQNVLAAQLNADWVYYEALAHVKAHEALIGLQDTPAAQVEWEGEDEGE